MCMHVGMRIYVCICVPMYACIYIHVCTCIYPCMYSCVCICMCVFVCVHVLVCAFMCTCVCVCTCLCMYLCVRVRACACTHVCVCIYLCMYALHVFMCLRVCLCVYMCVHVCACMSVCTCVFMCAVFMCVHACLCVYMCVHVCVSVLYACACLHVCAAITVLTSGPGTPTSLQAENPGESDLDVPGSVWQMWVERWVLEQKALPRRAGRWVPPAQEPRGWGIMVLLRVKVQSRGGTDPTLFPPHEADNESCYRTGGKAQTAEGPRRPRSRWAAGTRSRPAPSLPAATAHAEGGLLHRTAGRLPANTKAPRRPNLLNTSSSPEASTTKGWSQTLGMRAWPRG